MSAVLRAWFNASNCLRNLFVRLGATPRVLARVVEHLEGISLDRTELDTKGVAFEEFMGGFFKGDFGPVTAQAPAR